MTRVPAAAAATKRRSGAVYASLSLTGSEGTLVDGSRFLALERPLELPAGFEGSVVAVVNVPREHVNRYGVIDPAGELTHDGVIAVRDLVEKPAPEDAPRFTKGDLVVLMLKRAEGAAHYQVVGMNQGYLRVIEGKVLDVPEALPVEEFLERIKGATNKNE